MTDVPGSFGLPQAVCVSHDAPLICLSVCGRWAVPGVVRDRNTDQEGCDNVPRTCLIVDFGGVLTTSLGQAARGFEAREGLPDGAVDQTWYANPAMVRLTGDLECGRITQGGWNRRAARVLGVDDDNLLGRIFADLRPDERMVAVVARARAAGLKVGLLSNSVGLAPWDMYRGVDLGTAFDAALLSEQCGLRKPEPEIYEILLKMLGVPGEECVFVDDNEGNLPPAEALGMGTVLHREAARTIPRLEELLGVSLGAGRRPGGPPPAARRRI